MNESATKTGSSAKKQWTLFGLAFIFLAIYLVDYLPDRRTEPYSQMSLRLSIVLGTLWLAFPQLEQIFQSLSLSLVLLGLLAAFVIARNPVILISIVVLVVVVGVLKFAIRAFNEG